MTPREAYNVLVVGFLFVSINLHINGYGILLPTSLGYGMIWLGCYELRFKQHSFAWTSYVAITLAVLTLPQLVHGDLSQQAIELIYLIAHWPAVALELSLIVLFTISVSSEATFQNKPFIKPIALMAIPIAIASSTTAWVFSEDENPALILPLLIYVAPTYYLALVSRIAAVCLTSVAEKGSAG